jgi:methylglyoxal synthase
MQKRGRIAFITTPEYRNKHPEEIEDFICRYLYRLCNSFEVLSTGRTYGHIMNFISRPLDQLDRAAIEEGTQFPIEREVDLLHWRRTIEQGLTPTRPSISGMIELAFDLVEGRLDAVIHLTDWADVAGKPDSMVLRREANVHNVFIASDIHSAISAVGTWTSRLAKLPSTAPIFQHRDPPEELPLKGLAPDHRVLALIAHDNMKLDLCCFMVEHAKQIFDDFDYILATGTTGKWLKKFALAAGRTHNEVNKIRFCLSGPYGGDVQIAAAVVRKICQKVIFLQDPFTSHAHETDIRLFEQAVLLFERTAMAEGVDVELATNLASAKAILGLS